MEVDSSMLAHISNVELLSRRLEATGSRVEKSDIIMKLLSRLPAKYRALDTALETREAKPTLTVTKWALENIL